MATPEAPRLPAFRLQAARGTAFSLRERRLIRLADAIDSRVAQMQVVDRVDSGSERDESPVNRAMGILVTRAADALIHSKDYSILIGNRDMPGWFPENDIPQSDYPLIAQGLKEALGVDPQQELKRSTIPNSDEKARLRLRLAKGSGIEDAQESTGEDLKVEIFDTSVVHDMVHYGLERVTSTLPALEGVEMLVLRKLKPKRS